MFINLLNNTSVKILSYKNGADDKISILFTFQKGPQHE
jgi:hypothetical protein